MKKCIPSTLWLSVKFKLGHFLCPFVCPVFLCDTVLSTSALLLFHSLSISVSAGTCLYEFWITLRCLFPFCLTLFSGIVFSLLWVCASVLFHYQIAFPVFVIKGFDFFYFLYSFACVCFFLKIFLLLLFWKNISIKVLMFYWYCSYKKTDTSKGF